MMRKRNVKKELLKFPVFIFLNFKLVQIQPPQKWDGYELHHFITTQFEQENPEKFEQVKHLQKLILLPPVMHRELHNKHSKFKQKYGIDPDELLFDWRKYMLSAAAARKKSAENCIKNKLEYIEKMIKKSVDAGRNEQLITGTIDKIVLDELTSAGYEYKFVQGGIKIYW